jgi:two-component system sensor histidine kinase PilS (NtrC family)
MILNIFKQPAFTEKDFLPTSWSRDMVFALRIYIVLKAIIASIASFSFSYSSVENFNKIEIFQIYCWAVIVYSVVQYFTTTNRDQPLKNITFLFFALDLSFITLIASTQSSEVATTPLLMYICIASASMILRLRLGIILAIFAITITIFEHYIREETESINSTMNMLSIEIVGILFSCYFLALLARRVRSEEIKTKIETARSTALIDINHELIQNLEMGIIVIDGNGHVETCNPAAASLFNKDNADDIKSISELDFKLKKLWRKWINGTISENAQLTIGEDEIQLDVLFSKLGQEGKFSKITLSTETLLREQAQRYSLERMGRMASAIAHEIRNPLTSITTANELLSHSSDATPSLQKPISIISRNSLRINQIIEDILAIGHSKQADMQKIELPTWVKVFLGDYIESKNIDQECFIEISRKDSRDDLTINFSASHLKQILTNLCDNALLHGKSNSKNPVVIKLRTQNNKVFLEVFSPGETIDRDEASKIFEPFYTTKANQGGTGLGLYLCQQICELNLGFISHKRYANGNGFKISFYSKNIDISI